MFLGLWSCYFWKQITLYLIQISSALGVEAYYMSSDIKGIQSLPQTDNIYIILETQANFFHYWD